MTRILAISNMYPPHYLGGYELNCRDSIAHWRANGHEVSLLTSTFRLAGVDDDPDEAATGVWRELELYWDDHVLLNPSLRGRLAIERVNQRSLRRALDASRPEVVSVWNMGVLSMGLLATVVDLGIPIVFCVCDEWLLYGPELDAWCRLFRRRPLTARLVRRLTGVPTALPDLGGAGPFCFVSDRIRQRARELGPWHLWEANVVHTGIDTGDFPILQEPQATEWSWRLLYVGRLDQRKGVDTVVRALPHLSGHATLEVLGRGDQADRARLDGLMAQVDVTRRVAFDAVGREHLADRYRAADVFIFPSIWEEPFGLTPLEAMACGTPVVATCVGGSAEFLVDGENCLRFEPGDDRALAAAVQRLADNPALRQRLVAAGFETARAFTMDQMARELEAWHLFAASGDPAARPSPTAPRMSRPA